MSSGDTQTGQMRGAQEAETVGGGGGHGGVVLTLLLGSSAFVFNKNGEWHSLFCWSRI